MPMAERGFPIEVLGEGRATDDPDSLTVPLGLDPRVARPVPRVVRLVGIQRPREEPIEVEYLAIPVRDIPLHDPHHMLSPLIAS
jgi:hypothetical protein